MSKQEFIQWICDKLTALLQFEVQNDVAEYVQYLLFYIKN